MEGIPYASNIKTKSSSVDGSIASKYSNTVSILARWLPPPRVLPKQLVRVVSLVGNRRDQGIPSIKIPPHAIKVGIGYPKIAAVNSVLHISTAPLDAGSRTCSF